MPGDVKSTLTMMMMMMMMMGEVGSGIRMMKMRSAMYVMCCLQIVLQERSIIKNQKSTNFGTCPEWHFTTLKYLASMRSQRRAELAVVLYLCGGNNVPTLNVIPFLTLTKRWVFPFGAQLLQVEASCSLWGVYNLYVERLLTCSNIELTRWALQNMTPLNACFNTDSPVLEFCWILCWTSLPKINLVPEVSPNTTQFTVESLGKQRYDGTCPFGEKIAALQSFILHVLCSKIFGCL